MTLRREIRVFQQEIDLRHKRTEYGYVDGVSLDQPGDKSQWHQHDSDNDGLWTSMYGAGECFEYAVTRSPESKQRADAAFKAVAFLSEVPQGGKQSPPVGFPARTILPVSGRNPNDQDNVANDLRNQQRDPLWKSVNPRWPVNADQKWYWKSDTSSDELDGHYFFYGLYYDLVAETAEEKQQARAVVERVTNHLIVHDYALIDHDGKPTRWGQFGPSVLNTDTLTDLRGLNAISILSYLLVAEHVTGNEKYRRHYLDLLEKHNYFTNVLQPKHQNGQFQSQSDDEMAFMTLLRPVHIRIRSRSCVAVVIFAVFRARRTGNSNPLFDLIYAAAYMTHAAMDGLFKPASFEFRRRTTTISTGPNPMGFQKQPSFGHRAARTAHRRWERKGASSKWQSDSDRRAFREPLESGPLATG